MHEVLVVSVTILVLANAHLCLYSAMPFLSCCSFSSRLSALLRCPSSGAAPFQELRPFLQTTWPPGLIDRIDCVVVLRRVAANGTTIVATVPSTTVVSGAAGAATTAFAIPHTSFRFSHFDFARSYSSIGFLFHPLIGVLKEEAL